MTKIEQETKILVDNAIAEIFIELNTKYKTKAADVEPYQMLRLSYLSDELIKVIADQVKKNIY